MSRLVDPDEVGSSSASSSTSSTTSRAPSTAARPASTASVQRGSGRSSSSSSSGGGGGVDEPEEPPSHLNTIERLMFLDVSKDKLTATYVGKGHHPQDVGVRATPSYPHASRRVLTHTHTHTPSTYTIVRCDGIGDLSSQAIQANKPMMRRCRVAYFEVELLSTSQPSAASVGISDRHFSLCRHPGWEPKYAPMARTLTLRLSGVRVLNHAATARMDTTAATATSSPAVEANHSDPSSSRAT